MYAGFQRTILRGPGEKYQQTSHSFENLGFLPVDFDISECLGFFYKVTDKYNVATWNDLL